MMLLDPNDEDGVCGDAYQEWQNSYDATLMLIMGSMRCGM